MKAKKAQRAATRPYTSKQMGDACEFLLAAEMTLAGVPATKVPDLWPAYDIIAQPRDGRTPQRVSVKSRSYKTGAAYVSYNAPDEFEWLAIVLLPAGDSTERWVFVVPRRVADAKARRNRPGTQGEHERYFRIDEVGRLFEGFRDNYVLSTSPRESDHAT